MSSSALLVLCMSSVALAQAPEQSQIVGDFQKQMDAKRVQMNALQDRIKELEGKGAENQGLHWAGRRFQERRAKPLLSDRMYD